MEKAIDPINRKIGVRISQCCDMRKMTRHELSIRADISEQMLSKIISGRQEPKASTLFKIAKALQIPFSALQPDDLDQFGSMPADLLEINEWLKRQPGNIQTKIITSMKSIIDIWT